MEIKSTQRGFARAEFVDQYGEVCSIQKSSLATDDCIWLGINNPQLTVFEDESKGKYVNAKMPDNFMVSSRMHLTREQVADLLPLLQRFVQTGELYSDDAPSDDFTANKSAQFLVPHLIGNPVDAIDSFVNLAIKHLTTGFSTKAHELLMEAQKPLEEAKSVIHDFRSGKYEPLK